MIARLTRVTFIISLFLAHAFGQSPADWASLRQTPAATRIQVKTSDKKTYAGQFKSADDDALVMTGSKGEQTFPRAMVSRLSVRKPSHRGRNTLIGLGIGIAGGLILGAIADARCTGNCIEGNHAYGKEVGTGLGAVIGTIIGVALPTGGWREVYRTP